MTPRLYKTGLLMAMAGILASSFAHADTRRSNQNLTPATQVNSPYYGQQLSSYTGDYGVQSSLPFDMQGYVVPSPRQQLENSVNSYVEQQLTPEQINKLRGVVEGREQALAPHYTKSPIPIKKSMVVDLSPDAPLQVIRVAKGIQTTIAFVDENGEAWDIESVSINDSIFQNYTSQLLANNTGLPTTTANAQGGGSVSTQGGNAGTIGFDPSRGGNGLTHSSEGGFGVEGSQADYGASAGAGTGGASASSAGGSSGTPPLTNISGMTKDNRTRNIISFEPRELYGTSNMTVKLKGKTIPVVFLIHIGQQEVDTLITAYVSGKNPSVVATNTGVTGGTTMDTHIDNHTLAFLDGRIPEGAENLVSSDVVVQAWKYNNNLYLKTRYDVLTPRYHSKASLQGYSVYRFNDANKVKQVVMLQQQGKPVTVHFDITPYYMR